MHCHERYEAPKDLRYCRRIQGTGETVFLDVWTNVVPAGALTPQAVWSKIALPDSRVWEMTQQWGVPMNITFRNATSYVVSPRRKPYGWHCRQARTRSFCSASFVSRLLCTVSRQFPCLKGTCSEMHACLKQLTAEGTRNITVTPEVFATSTSARLAA